MSLDVAAVLAEAASREVRMASELAEALPTAMASAAAFALILPTCLPKPVVAMLQVASACPRLCRLRWRRRLHMSWAADRGWDRSRDASAGLGTRRGPVDCDGTYCCVCLKAAKVLAGGRRDASRLVELPMVKVGPPPSQQRAGRSRMQGIGACARSASHDAMPCGCLV